MTSSVSPRAQAGEGAGSRHTHKRRSSLSWIWIIFATGLALSPLADFLSVKAAHGADGGAGDARYSLLLRGSMAVGLFVVLLSAKSAKLSSWRIGLLAIVAGLASAATYALGDMSAGEVAQQEILILKVFSFFVCLAALSGLRDDELEALKPMVRYTLLAYALAILAGAVFSIDMFRSYWGDTEIRAGYKGIVYAQNEASALMIAGLGYGLLTVLISGWSVANGAFVACFLLASGLVGTKAALAGAVSIMCGYLYSRHRVPQATLRALAVVASFVFIAAAAYLCMPAVRSAVDLSVQYFTYQHDHAGQGATLSTILSGRDLKFSKVWDDVSSGGYMALLTGGYPIVRYLIEIDLPDLILAMGLPVCAIYLCMLAKPFLHRGDGSVLRFGKWFFVVLMATACTAGHVLVSAIVSPYLAMIAVLLQRAAASRRQSLQASKSSVFARRRRND